MTRKTFKEAQAEIDELFLYGALLAFMIQQETEEWLIEELKEELAGVMESIQVLEENLETANHLY